MKPSAGSCWWWVVNHTFTSLLPGEIWLRPRQINSLKKKKTTQLTRKSKFPPLFALDGKLLSLPGILSRCLESQRSQFGSRAKWLALEVGADSRGRSRMTFLGLSRAAACFQRTHVGTNSCAAIQTGDRDMAQGLQCPRWAGNIEQGLCSTGLRTTILGLQRPACG